MTEDQALGALRDDDRARVARAEAALWAMWCRSGRRELDALLAEGVEALERRDFDAAITRFTRLVEATPEWAEAWNKRATARYLAGDYAGAVADCEATLARKPHHFGALAGQGLCHLQLEQYSQAAALFRRALAVHPHLDAVRQNLRSALAEVVRYN
ncbi:MAG: tetratricopeptide repeat protein [Candidatus Rokuibacteriota bacterium]|nr:MAG: tetratricopeptide repeat protein [Candidatus Rokubacteria bacterium]